MKLTHLFIVAFYLVAFCYVASGEQTGKHIYVTIVNPSSAKLFSVALLTTS